MGNIEVEIPDRPCELLEKIAWYRRGMEESLDLLYDTQDIAIARARLEDLLKNVREREKEEYYRYLNL